MRVEYNVGILERELSWMCEKNGGGGEGLYTGKMGSRSEGVNSFTNILHHLLLIELWNGIT